MSLSNQSVPLRHAFETHTFHKHLKYMYTETETVGLYLISNTHSLQVEETIRKTNGTKIVLIVFLHSILIWNTNFYSFLINHMITKLPIQSHTNF